MNQHSIGFVIATLALAGPTLGQKIYGIDWNGEIHGSDVGDRVVVFDASDPELVTELGQTGVGNAHMSGLEFANGGLWAYSSDPPGGRLYTIDLFDGAATLVGGGGLIGGDTITDLAWSEVDQRMYAVEYQEIAKVRFYEIDLTTGAASLAFELDEPTTTMMTTAFAIDPVSGDFYVHDLTQDRLFVQVGTELVPLPGWQGFVGFVFGMTFDPNTATLYVADWRVNRYELRVADLATGEMTFLGNIGPVNGGSGMGEYKIADLAVPQNDCMTTRYCNPSTGSANNVATISISGCELSDGVLVRLSNAPANQFTYLLIGDGNQVVSQPPGAKGDLCVVGGECLGRYAKDIGAVAADGTFATSISASTSGGPSFGIPTCGGSIQMGQTWNFQYWHRQPMGQPSTFSEAIRVTFK